nr:MAG TPA: terminase small subunit [Caudoviricetes sp.]
MARPCKPAKLLTECSQTKEEISARQRVEEKLRGEPARLSPPGYLSKTQKKIFKNLLKFLEPADVLGGQDVYLLTLCAIALDRMQAIEQMINEDPARLADRDLITAKAKYTQDFLRCCNELGLSPQSRAKLGNIALQKKQEAADPVMRLLQGGMAK